MQSNFSTSKLDFFQDSQHVQEKRLFYECSHHTKLGKGQGGDINKFWSNQFDLPWVATLFPLPSRFQRDFFDGLYRAGPLYSFYFLKVSKAKRVVTLRNFQRLLPS